MVSLVSNDNLQPPARYLRAWMAAAFLAFVVASVGFWARSQREGTPSYNVVVKREPEMGLFYGKDFV